MPRSALTILAACLAGADIAPLACQRLIHGRTGAVEAFDVTVGPGRVYHEIMRNEGVESIALLGTTYQALKISHSERVPRATPIAP